MVRISCSNIPCGVVESSSVVPASVKDRMTAFTQEKLEDRFLSSGSSTTIPTHRRVQIRRVSSGSLAAVPCPLLLVTFRPRSAGHGLFAAATGPGGAW